MTRYLLDTGPAGDFIHRRDEIFEKIRSLSADGHKFGTTPIVIGEIWAGVENSKSRERNIEVVRHNLPALTCWPFDEQAAREYGRIQAELRQRGRPMQQNDVQIAAVATVMKCVVVSYDSDLKAVPGLKVENWRES